MLGPDHRCELELTQAQVERDLQLAPVPRGIRIGPDRFVHPANECQQAGAERLPGRVYPGAARGNRIKGLQGFGHTLAVAQPSAARTAVA